MGTLVAHEVKIGDSVFIAHGCSISGCVRIEDGVFIGTNATIIPRLEIGKWATIGAGAVVIDNVPEYSTVVGNPGKVIKYSEKILMEIFLVFNSDFCFERTMQNNVNRMIGSKYLKKLFRLDCERLSINILMFEWLGVLLSSSARHYGNAKSYGRWPDLIVETGSRTEVR
jgi:hypothetical protein